MIHWRVADVMTTDVVTINDSTSIAEIADVLTERHIGAAPVVDRFDVVTGIVSWTDLRRAIDSERSDGRVQTAWRRRRQRLQPRWAAGTAIDVMSAPPVTIQPDASLTAASRTMHRKAVGRLLVVDHKGRLAGIVTRRDLLKMHSRLDAVVREDVLRVLHRTLAIEPGAVQVTVAGGAVTLTGRTPRKTTASAAAALAAAVPGVTAVTNDLSFDADDTVQTATQPSAEDPLRGWWTTAALTSTTLPRRGCRTAGEQPAQANNPRPAATQPAGASVDIVDQWGEQSFPASDPPATWWRTAPETVPR